MEKPMYARGFAHAGVAIWFEQHDEGAPVSIYSAHVEDVPSYVELLYPAPILAAPDATLMVGTSVETSYDETGAHVRRVAVVTGSASTREIEDARENGLAIGMARGFQAARQMIASMVKAQGPGPRPRTPLDEAFVRLGAAVTDAFGRSDLRERKARAVEALVSDLVAQDARESFGDDDPIGGLVVSARVGEVEWCSALLRGGGWETFARPCGWRPSPVVEDAIKGLDAWTFLDVVRRVKIEWMARQARALERDAAAAPASE